ncbi:MAG TPA: hypothetical protein VE422_08900 [Terriglobia bacterium]|nr:hypothetical protein [Terriglobia bacterium]
MRSSIRVFLTILLLCARLPATFAQNTTTQTGFAIITLVSGNIAGLIATETLINSASGGVSQATVGPSVLVSSASVLVTIGRASENTTAIALANPSLGSGSVNLLVTNEQGGVVLNAIVKLGPRGHLATFLNDLFAVQPTGTPTPALLTISAEIPVAILVLNFRDGDFTSIPLTSLANPMPVPVQLLTPLSGVPNSGPGFGLGVAGPLAGISNFGPGFGLGVAGPTPPPVIVTPPVTVSTSPVPTVTSIGGAASLAFPQIATGGGWSTEFAVGNTSSALQVIRIDFFGNNGANLASLTDITIPSQGVFFFSTASAGFGAF